MWKDQEFKANLGYTGSLSQNSKKQKQKGRGLLVAKDGII
jgi:hypothetical protein